LSVIKWGKERVRKDIAAETSIELSGILLSLSD